MKKVSTLLVLIIAFSFKAFSASVDAGVIGPATLTVYSGSSVESIITFTTAPSGGVVVGYTWYRKTFAAMLWSEVSNSNNDTLKISGLTEDYYYKCEVSFMSAGTDETNEITVDVIPAFDPGTIQSDSMVCKGDVATLSFKTAPAGGTGTFTYQWQYYFGLVLFPFSTELKSKSLDEKIIIAPKYGWRNISGATSDTYTTSEILSSTSYRCVVTAGAGGVGTSSFKIIIDSIKADFTMSDTLITVGGSVDFTSTSRNAETYKWDFGNGMTSTDKNSSTFYNTAGAQTVQLIVISPKGCPDTLMLDSAVVVEEPNSVDFNVDSSPSIYPQPATRQVFVNLNDATEAKIIIYSVSGEKIMEQQVVNNSSLDISVLPAGTYMVSIECNNGQIYMNKLLKE